MLSLEGGRKRRRETQNNGQAPLQGVIACMSGFSQADKDEMQALVKKLGGEYVCKPIRV